MNSENNTKLAEIVLNFLEPLSHLMLESGIGHREFSELAKQAFVGVATSKYGIRGRQTNISRVAVMTGLTRKEVKRIRDENNESAQSAKLKPVPASVVLQQWFLDPDFLESNGTPRVLEYKGQQGSFKALVNKYVGDIPPGAIRTELKRTNAIQELPNGKLEVLRREYIAHEGVDQIVRALERPLRAMLQNLRHNNTDSKSKHPYAETGWPERIVQSGYIDEADRPEVYSMVRRRVRAFSEDLDEALRKYEKVQTNDSKAAYVGLGMYYFESEK